MSVCGHWHPTPEPCMLITLQDITMVSSSVGIFGVSTLDGWRNGVAATGGPAPFENADGGVMGDIYAGGRSIVVEGDIDAPDHEAYMRAEEQLGALLTRPRTAQLVVDERFHLGVTRQIEVTRLRPPQITQMGPSYGIFTLTLEAATYLRLGVDEQSVTVPTGGVDLLNIGNDDAHVTARLIGPLTNPGLSWPGSSWRYTGTVSSGQTLTVDMHRRTVRDLGTAAHSRNQAAGTWLSLAPGTTRVSRTGTGSGRIELGWRSSWA